MVALLDWDSCPNTRGKKVTKKRPVNKSLIQNIYIPKIKPISISKAVQTKIKSLKTG
jgi:hypothetical protein